MSRDPRAARREKRRRWRRKEAAPRRYLKVTITFTKEQQEALRLYGEECRAMIERGEITEQGIMEMWADSIRRGLEEAYIMGEI